VCINKSCLAKPQNPESGSANREQQMVDGQPETKENIAIIISRYNGTNMIPTREEAWKLVTEFTASDSLRRHMLAVEAAMRAYAKRFSEDPDVWGVVGLLHDFDYERYPDISVQGHPSVGATLLRQRGVDEEVVQAILSHAPEVTGRPPESQLEKTLYAVDELTGFIVAVALVRPSKRLADVELKSVKKKWKDKAFAAPVNRDEIDHAASELGVPLDEHIQFVLDAMKAHASELGLG
jgi:putative nucleotidyltransferase with HDIG domain